jgi:hypothetical protein
LRIPYHRLVRFPRVLVSISMLALLLATAGAASAATVNGGIAGLGTGESSSPTTNFGHLDTSQCVVGAIPVTQTETTYYRCALEFDITTVPSDAVVTAATLNIYSDSMTPCTSTPCGMVVSGYAGNADISLADLTAGSPIGEEAMATGSYSQFDVKTFVKSVLAGSDIPIAGFNLAGDLQNPLGAWTVVGSPSGPHPPTLVITYGIPVSLTVAVAPPGSGTVAAEGSSISCPGTCSGTYLPGAQVKLHANPANGYAFLQWAGASCAGQGSVCSFTMPSSAVSVSAGFVSTAPVTDPPSNAPSQGPPKTQAPGRTTTPGQPTDAPATAAPTDAAATGSTATIEPATPAPTIVGLDDPNAQPASDTGGPGILIFLVVAVVVAIGIGFGVYRYAGARAPKP